jgi:GAF domain-containing protein
MRKRAKVGGARAKTRRPKARKPNRRNIPKADLRAQSTPSGEKVARLTRERDEALQQQAATSEVLKIIRQSPANTQPVFDAIVESAALLSGAIFSVLYLYDGDRMSIGATSNFNIKAIGRIQEIQQLKRPERSHLAGRAILERSIVHVPDVLADPEYSRELAMVGGWRAVLSVPLLREGNPVGALSVGKAEPTAFSDRQVRLLQTFADQAVIAIENTRLLNELRESLEQQTATSEVLQIISRSPGDLQPVFHAMLANAVQICDATFGNLLLFEDGAFRTVALHNAPQPYLEERQREPVIRPNPGSALDQLVKTKKIVHVPDMRAEGMASSSAIVKLGGARTMLSVPMLKENELVGAILIYRQEVSEFTDKQIALLQNFADQAVIAIENARLLKELRKRTADLTESLERQTATSEVLEVISNSPGELEPVYKAILENATRICEAKFGGLQLYENGSFRVGALHNAPPAFAALRQREPLYRPDPLNPLARVAATKKLLHILDMTEDEAYKQREANTVAFVDLSGTRTVLTVPMLKEAEVVGVISVFRQEIRPFTDKQIALLQNFAAQAVIAIENARLLNELRELNQNLEQRVADQVGEIERMGRLRRFLPPQVADLIVASGTERQLESHRREITALFCDLRGFTGFSESSDPEDVMALLRDYHAAIGEIIIKYSGTLERYAGDGVMVVFNDPVPVDNPALQAVLMALEMRGAIGALTEKWRRLGHDIGFGIGIAHGFATLGTIGFEGRFDYAAIGTVSNVASRLCDEARPGQILISPRVLMAVEGAVTVEPVGEFALKGIRRPLAAHNIVAAKSSN